MSAESYHNDHVCVALGNAMFQLKNAKSFEKGIINTCNLGGDCITNAAVAGALLGAKFGYNGLPSDFLMLVKNASRNRKQHQRRNMNLTEFKESWIDKWIHDVITHSEDDFGRLNVQ